ncbi:MAG: TonB-dependent receptor, partial [Thiohalobacteraceae bacterium]
DLTDVDTDGYRRHSAAQRRNEQLVLKCFLSTGGRYHLLFNGLDLDALDPQGLTAEQLAGDRRAASQGALTFNTRKTVRQKQIGARIEHDLSEAQALSLTAHGGRRETSQMLSVPVTVQQNNPLHGGGAIDLERDYYGVDARWRWSAALWGRPLTLTTGFQYEVSDDLRRGYENFQGDQLGVFGALRRDERNRVTGQDLYVQAAWQWSARWHINLGARYSRVRFRSDDRFITPDNPDDSGRLAYSQWLPVIGALYRATPSLSLYANAGGGFETPTSTELAYRSDGLSGLNDELDPARSKNVEIGLRAREERLQYSAALFYSRTEDELVVVANQGGRSVYGNAGVSRRRGAELALSGELSSGWRYAASYTFLDARYLSDFAVCSAPPCAIDENLIEAGRHIPGLSRHFGWAELVWTPVDDTDIALEGRFVDRLYVNDANSEAAPAYASFDFSVERRIASGGFEWRGFVRLNNLFDREIVGSVIVNEANGRYFEPAPGRNWVVGVSLAKVFD